MSDRSAEKKVARYHCYKWEGDEQVRADAEKDADGEWVRYKDYAALLARVAELEEFMQAEVDAHEERVTR